MKKGSIFPPGKIKKIIQQNQEVGKLANVVPHLIQRSLEIFLDQLTDKINEITHNNDLDKVQAPIIKQAIEKMEAYHFLKQSLEDLQEFNVMKKKKSEVKSQKIGKKKSSKDQNERPKRKGRKKLQQSQKSKSNEEQEYQQQQQVEMKE